MEVRARLAQVERRATEVRTPGRRVSGVRRLLVVRHDRLGDLVLSLPAVHALGRTYPEARLTLMVRRGLAPLARMVEGVDAVIEAEPEPPSLRRQIETLEPDLAVCIARDLDIGWAVSRARVPERIGTAYRSHSPLFNRRVVERRRAGGRHECEYALSFAHRAGAEATEAIFPLVVPPTVLRGAREWLLSQAVEPPFVLLHPGSGGSCPVWPPEHYLDLAVRLAAKGLRPVFSIGPADRWLDRLLDDAPHPVRALPRTSAGLETLAALVGLAGVVVTNSTGPLHLAAALGTPTLGLYPPWPTCGLARWGPYAENGWGLVAEHEGAAGWSRGLRRRRAGELMRALRPEAVERATLKVLGES